MKIKSLCLWILMPNRYGKLGVHSAPIFTLSDLTWLLSLQHCIMQKETVRQPEEKTGLSLATAVRLVWLRLRFCINHLLSCPLFALHSLLSYPTSPIVPPPSTSIPLNIFNAKKKRYMRILGGTCASCSIKLKTKKDPSLNLFSLIA